MDDSSVDYSRRAGARRHTDPGRLRSFSTTLLRGVGPVGAERRRGSAPGNLAADLARKVEQRSVPSFTPLGHLVVSDPALDAGNKYLQQFGQHSSRRVRHVEPLGGGSRGKGIGVRMEDVGTVRRGLAHALDCGVVVVVVADGHGSVPVYSESADLSLASWYIGGPECATIVAKTISRYLDRVSKLSPVPVSFFDRSAIAQVFYDAFACAQRACLDEIYAGAAYVTDSAEDTRKRLSRLVSNKVDGAYFASLYSSPRGHRDPRYLIVDKVAVPYHMTDPLNRNPNVIYYVDSSGRNMTVADYGTTATAAIFVPTLVRGDRGAERQAEDAAWCGTLYVAHTGDSDAYLFHKGDDGFYKPVRLTGDHSVTNDLEAARLCARGMVRRDKYWVLASGPERGHALMPSRSFGHPLLGKHGVTWEPTVSATMLAPDDVVVVASDGLWALLGRCAYGVRRRKRDDGDPFEAENLSADYVALILDETATQPVDNVAHMIVQQVKKHVPEMDNTCVVVARVSAGEDEVGVGSARN